MTLPASKRQDDGWHITYDSYTIIYIGIKKHTEGRKAGWLGLSLVYIAMNFIFLCCFKNKSYNTAARNRLWAICR